MNGNEVIFAIAAIYFLPWLIAGLRCHHNQGAIFVLNLFLGWTFLGWIAALVWSVTAKRPIERAPRLPDLRSPRARRVEFIAGAIVVVIVLVVTGSLFAMGR